MRWARTVDVPAGIGHIISPDTSTSFELGIVLVISQSFGISYFFPLIQNFHPGKYMMLKRTKPSFSASTVASTESLVFFVIATFDG